MPSTELHRDIEIDAPPEAVWSVLTDTQRYGEWNPFVRSLSGHLTEGSTIEAQIAPPDGRTMTFKPTVLRATAARELRWLGRLFVPGIFDGEHRFLIEPLDGGRSRFIQSERFSGVLVRLLAGTLRKTAAGFEQMNVALKREVEARTAALA